MIIGFLMALAFPATAQDEPVIRISEKEAIDLALKNNPRIKIAGLEVQSKEAQQKTAFRLPSTEVGLQYGQINSAAHDPFVEITQNLGSLPAHLQRSKVQRHHVGVAQARQALTVKDLTYEVRNSWHEWLYLRQVTRELEHQLSYYENYEQRAALQYQLGERSLLEKTLIENSLYALKNNYIVQSENLKQALAGLKFLLTVGDEIFPEQDTLLSLMMPVNTSPEEHPAVGVLEEELRVREAESRLQRSLLFPELRIGYFRQNISEADIRFKGLQGWTFGVSIPLWFRPQQGNIQRAAIERLQAREELVLGERRLDNARVKAMSNVEKYERLLTYYRGQGLAQADAILRTATLQMDAGEIDFFQYLQSMERYTETRLQYLETVRNYNLSIIELEYLSK